MSSAFFDIMEGMKKAIVFDLGNVLVTFNLQEILDDVTNNRQIQKEIMDFYYPSLWNEYDRGMYSKQEMIDLGIEKYPGYQKEINHFMNEWIYGLVPIQSTIQLIQDLKEKGYPIYILSNIPKQALDYLQTIEILQPLLKRGIYSYQHQVNKPDIKIYEILMDTYNLAASDILFIDDKKENIETAKQLGMDTIHCTDPNELETQVRKKL